MVPKGYVGLVVADTRRALQWEAGLRAAGFDVARVETTGPDADKGDWRICVVEAQQQEARALVTDVVRGDATLPSRPLLTRTGWIALFGVMLTILVVWVGAWLATR